MQKTIYTAITAACAILIAYLTFNFDVSQMNPHQAVAVSVSSPIEVLFEHTLNQETFLLYRTQGGDDLSIAFLRRSLRGVELVASTTQYDIAALTDAAGLNYAVLPQSDRIPYTVYAGVVSQSDVHEVFVAEPHFPIIHGIRLLESQIPGTYIWMVMSPDFLGQEYTIVGVDQEGITVADIENDGVSRVFHPMSP